MADLPTNVEPGDIEDTTVAIDEKTRIQKVKERHIQMANERAGKQNELIISYKKIKDSAAFKDILDKAKSFHDYHLKLAKDGVGYQQTGAKDDSGNPVQQTVFFSHEKRVTELDKAAGVEELLLYIERQTSDEALQPKPPKKVVS